MRALLAGVALAAMLSVSTSAQSNEALAQEHYLREVEVSLWELVAAAMYHAAAPDAQGQIRGGQDPDTTPTDEFQKQIGEVEQHWTQWKAVAGDDSADAAAAFEAAYLQFVSLAEEVISTDSPSDAQLLEMWRAAHAADDVLDQSLKVTGQ
ncbi:hypothetical protein [Bauldia sp.]|uniref:hypothetical protein n=1 Tax=Bauldia sp. TaxID=2575872 RepID=UPI003BAB8809